jgi:nucleoside-diphosphate-sugar epimerase
LDDEGYLDNSLKDVDTVVHIAGIGFSSQITKAAVKNHVRRLILVHTTGIYSKYKAAGEEYRKIDDFIYKTCKEHNIVLTILRPTMIYGNISDNNVVQFIKMVDKLPVMPVVNRARYKLQPVHYEDLADAYYKVLINEKTTSGKDYNLSGGAEIELRQMLTVIGENLGKKVKFISCPFLIAYVGAWGLYLMSFTKKDYREKVQRLCEPRVFSYEVAKRDFGYKPRTFNVGIADEVKEYKEQTGKEVSFF